MFEMPKNINRLNHIMKLLYENKKIEISELRNILAVSQNTIYRDLKKLEKDNKLIRIKKGAAIYDIDSNNIEEYPFYFRLGENKKAKIKISETASNLISNNETIFLDASTTSVYLSKIIAKKNFSNLTVITPSPIVSVELLKNKNINILLLGGTINTINFCCYSDLNSKILTNLNIQDAFLGCSGFSIKKGYTEVVEEDFKLKKIILEIADKITMIVDHTKYNKISIYTLGDFKIAQNLVTDTNFEEEDLKEIKKMGVRLHFC